MKTLMKSLLLFVLMISSSLAQMGPAGPPPTYSGSVTFVQGGASPTSVGGGVSVLINATLPYADPIVAVYYNVTGGAYENQIISSDTTSCTNYPLTSKFTYLSFPQGWAGCGWFWDENSGAKSVDITVFLMSGTQVNKHYDYTIDKPDLVLFTLDGQPDRLGLTNNNEIALGSWGGGGVQIRARVHTNSAGGELGFIQKVSPNNYIKYKSNYWYNTVCGIHLLDHLPPSSAYWYTPPSNVNAATQDNIVQMWDYPTIRKVIDLTNYPKKLQINNIFNTSVVFRPTGGILVGIGRIDWVQNLTATYNGPADPTQTQYLNADNWVVDFNHPNGWEQNGEVASFSIQWEKSASQISDYQSEGQD